MYVASTYESRNKSLLQTLFTSHFNSTNKKEQFYWIELFSWQTKTISVGRYSFQLWLGCWSAEKVAKLRLINETCYNQNVDNFSLLHNTTILYLFLTYVFTTNASANTIQFVLNEIFSYSIPWDHLVHGTRKISVLLHWILLSECARID